PAREGAVADVVGLGVVEAAAGFGKFDVARTTQAVVDDVARAFGQQMFKLLFVEMVLAGTADASGHSTEHLLNQRSQVWLGVLVKKMGANESPPKVYAITDPAGRNHAALIGIGGADPADAKPITPVDIGHGQAGVLDAGQKG